jgi:DNA (cytosine-5)-methyltransferase 1
LETAGYAFGAADLCAAGVGSPQIRQRFYWMADANRPDENGWASGGQQSLHHADDRTVEGMGSANGQQWDGRGRPWDGRPESANPGGEPQGLGSAAGWQAWTCRQPWEQSEAVECEDGWRRIEPGASPLVTGIPARLDKIRGYGNAIVPQLAAEFIGAAMSLAVTRPHSKTPEK